MPFGRVIDFDEHVGLATSRPSRAPCTCSTASRSPTAPAPIDVGADVEFDLLVKFGEDEAANLRPAPAP